MPLSLSAVFFLATENAHILFCNFPFQRNRKVAWILVILSMLIIVSWIPRGKSAGENHLPMCTGTTGKRRRRGPALDHVEIRISPWPQERMSSAYRNKVMDCWLKASQEHNRWLHNEVWNTFLGLGRRIPPPSRH